MPRAKGDKLLQQGQAAEAKGDWDRALELYLQALDEKPNEPRIPAPDAAGAFRMRAEARGKRDQKLRADGQARRGAG